MLSDPQKNKINDTKYQVYVLNKMRSRKKHLIFFLKKKDQIFFSGMFNV